MSQLSEHVQSRRTLLDQLKTYHNQRLDVDRSLEGLQGDIQLIDTTDDVSLRDRIDQLEVRGFGWFGVWRVLLDRCGYVTLDLT